MHTYGYMYVHSFSYCTGVSKKFCNILVNANLWYVYHVTKAVHTVEGIHLVLW